MSPKINLLILGNRISSQALAWKLQQSDRIEQLYTMPKHVHNQNTSHNITPHNIVAITKFVREHKINMAIIEPPYATRELLQRFHAQRITILAPSPNKLTERSVLRDLMKSRRVPIPHGHVFENIDGIIAYCQRNRFPLLLKNDNICHNKSTICHCEEDLNDYLAGDFGDVDRGKIMVEEYVGGTPIGITAIIANNDIMTMPYCRILQSENRIVGACIPSKLNNKTCRNIERLILVPVVDVIKSEMPDYKGMISLEIAVTAKGPYLLDLEMYWQDSLCQVIVANLENDLLEIFLAVLEGRIDDIKPQWQKASTAVTLSVPSDIEKPPMNMDEPFFDFCDKKQSSLGMFASGDETGKVGDSLLQRWESHHLPENYHLYSALQSAKQSK